MSYLYRCPHCPPGQGGLAVNAAQVRMYAKAQPNAFEATFQDSPELTSMLCDVGYGAGETCPHLFYLSTAIYVVEVVQGSWTRRGEIYLIRHHPLLVANDLQQAAQEILSAYEPLSDGCQPRSLPTSRHHVADPDRTLRVEDPDSMWVMNTNSEVIAAANPGEFLEELRSWVGC